MTGYLQNTGNTSLPDVPESAVLDALIGRLAKRPPPGSRGQGLRLLGISGLAALPLYLSGILDAGQAAGLFLLGWLSLSRAGLFAVRVQGNARGILPRVLVQGLDMVFLLVVGWVCHALDGRSGVVFFLAAAAGLSACLAYYSAVSLLKAVPGGIRASHPDKMVELDHLFLSRASFWGGERELVLVPAGIGLLLGMPLAGLAAAALAGNLNWVLKSARFWREVRDARA